MHGGIVRALLIIAPSLDYLFFFFNLKTSSYTGTEGILHCIIATIISFNPKSLNKL